MFKSKQRRAAQCAATLENLQAALNGEYNAKARYLEFAVQADAEGFRPVGSLFRAAALAEDIHADNHKQVIAKMGAAPFVKFDIPEVNSTRENLLAAIRGESYEHDEMYPAFIAQARADAQPAAERTFAFAMTAEAEHARLFAAALNGLDQPRVSARNYFVCNGCGYTCDQPEFDQCPVCSTPVIKFQVVN